MSFEVNRVCDGVTHIRDCMGVCMTLIEGEKAALLVDTGYGVEDVAAFVETLTCKPVTVLLTHNHHDHALGSRWFEKTVMLPEDQAEWPVFTGDAKRRVVLGQALSKGLKVTEDSFLSGECRIPYAIHSGSIDLGGLTAEVIACPGHTPGSQTLLVDTEDGIWALTADLVNTRECWESDPKLANGYHTDLIVHYQSFDKVAAAADHILEGHEIKIFDHKYYPC